MTTLIRTHAPLLHPTFQTTTLLLGLTLLTISIRALLNPHTFAANFGIPLPENPTSENKPPASKNPTSENKNPTSENKNPATAYITLLAVREAALAIALLALLGLGEERAVSVLVVVLGAVVGAGDSVVAGRWGRKGSWGGHAGPGVMLVGVGIVGGVLSWGL
ncbi:MAG: hypothetical protein LQ344_001950 [Seirophora lacunosa]|nr:MAG: hypothetical protein LQ344_001950 [Seirophora lacunosa]